MQSALRYHYYEIRYYEKDESVRLIGRSYQRELSSAELFAIQMAHGGPTAKVKYMGGGTNSVPAWWAGPKDSWTIIEARP